MESEFRDALAELDPALLEGPFVQALVDRIVATGEYDPHAVIRAVEALVREAEERGVAR